MADEQPLVLDAASVDVLDNSQPSNSSEPLQKTVPPATGSDAPTSLPAQNGTEAAPSGAPTPTLECPAPAPTGSFITHGGLIAERYQVRGLPLGRGAQGSVYRVFDRHTESEVALKLMRETPFDGDAGRLRFLKEGALGGLVGQTPYTIKVIDSGEHQGLPYFTMEFFAGSESLYAALQPADAANGRNSDGLLYGYFAGQPHWSVPDIACSLVSKIALGLAPLHARGFVHRDLKPDNILLRVVDAELPIHLRFDLRIIDFGTIHDPTNRLTSAGSTLGTPLYMAPEVLAGEPYGPQSDLFALGLILYQLLTNSYPWPELIAPENRYALGKLCTFHREPQPIQPFKLHQDHGDLVTGFDYILRRALANDPTKRYQSAIKLLEDLAHVVYLADHLRAGKALPVPQSAPVVVQAPKPVDTTPLPAKPVVPGGLLSEDNPFAQFGALPSQPPAPPEPAQPEPSASIETPQSQEPAEQQDTPPAVVAQESSVDGVDLEALSVEHDQRTRQQTLYRLGFAGAAVVATLALFSVGAYYLDNLFSDTPAVESEAQQWSPREDPDEWVQDIRARPTITPEPVALLGAKPPAAQPPGTSESSKALTVAAPAPAPAAVARRRSRRPATPVEPESKAEDPYQFEVHPAYAKLYGSSPRAGGGGIIPAQGARATKAGANSIAGVRLSARLIDDVASEPTGSPVVAVLTQASKLGPFSLPAGTEIHGQTTGGQGPRLFVKFTFARFANSTRAPIKFNAIARGKDGRKGIPGKRNLDAGTAGGVASTGAGDAIRDAAGALAEAAGDVLGSDAIRSMGNKASTKVQTMAVEENLVVAPRGTVFAVYFQSL